jgi:hypothetical protein
MHTLSTRRALSTLAWLLCLAALVGCAQQVGDIDRTQPNKTRKADLDGVWFMMDTVTDVPVSSASTFIGETSKTEKIVWEVQENLLVAYRAYPLIPGAEDISNSQPTPDRVGVDNPIAAYPILSHFDIQRDYNSATGEQSNVLSENTTDRPWFQRDYMRVDWSQNLLINFDFISDWLPTPSQTSYFLEPERENARSASFERDPNGDLAYFDVPRRILLEPDVWGCILSSPWYVWSTEDCATAEVEIVTAFARTDPRRDYEPLHYDDQDMNRFGYFRSERYVHDPQRGPLDSIRQRLANRHNLWEATYRRDPNGDFARDDQGRLIPIPVPERTHRTIPYYLSATFPTDDPLLLDAARDTMNQWDRVGREAVAAAKGISPDQVSEVFVLCQHPVADDDHPACGQPGFAPRPGDLRHSTLYWVESDQLLGPLGYGPVASDPETGEILSGRAYVYGSGINTYASYGLDVIRFMNGSLDPDDLQSAQHIRDEVQRRARGSLDLDKVDPRLRQSPLRPGGALRPEKRALRESTRHRLNAYDPQVSKDRLERARAEGLRGGMSNGELQRALQQRTSLSDDALSDALSDRLHPSRWLSPTHLKELRRRRLQATARGWDGHDMIDLNVIGIARSYEGRDDYDQIWRELRAEIFRSTALHEVGHTVGLRHNFQGTFDSLNFFDEYWAARQENLKEPESLYDLYELSALTEAQIEARMREYQYSSIMDYGVAFNTDLKGLGRYDEAAFVYAYSAGSVLDADAPCDGTDRLPDPDGGCLVQAPGFVQVFRKRAKDLGGAADILQQTDEYGHRFDDLTTPNLPWLERWHYTTAIQSFPSIADAFDREWMRRDLYQSGAQQGGDDAPVRVPYLFCSDEWVGALLSCQVYDHGADMFEMTQTIVNDYRAYYYFHNFKRDRLVWDPTDALFRYFYYTFLPLSDYYQSWYLAPEGYDEVQDNYLGLALNMGFNLFSEAISTPPYGTFCTGLDGNLVHLSDEPGQTRAQASDFILTAYCDQDAPFYQIAQGQGRRRFTIYDADSGYHFDTRPQEAGHYWATLAAFWALIDPEAFVLGSEADVGTFAISYYDIFSDEIDQLVASVISEDYTAYSPLLEVTDESEGARTGQLHYRVPSPSWDPEQQLLFDPETGVPVADAQGPSRAATALCEPCTANAQCNGHDGFTGGTFCQPIDDTGARYCLQDCTDDPGLCRDSETCDDTTGNCLPTSGSCDGEVPSCALATPRGRCPSGQTCQEGACVDLWPVIESDATFSLFDDMVFYGMLYTTSNYSTRYNDRLNVFKMGGDEELSPGDGFEVLTFTDPVSGDAYGAIAESCEGDTLTGGPTGLCGACQEHTDCAGYTGDLGDTYCQPINGEDDPVWFCLQDCTDAPDACPAGTACNDAGNCAPEDLSCDGDEAPCGPANPLGACQDGATCQDGACVQPRELSPQCRYNLNRQTAGARMILRGQRLTQRYNETLEAYWADDGSNAERELRLFRLYSRARFDLESHVERLNDIRAVYDIFGKVY